MELECLRRADATIGEACFNLKRVVGTLTSSSQFPTVEDNSKKSFQLLALQESDRMKSAYALAIIWYLKNKLEQLYQESGGEDTDDSAVRASPTWKSVYQKIFMAIYPFLCMTHEGVQLMYQWCYLFHRTVYTTPIMHILGLVIRRVTASDSSTITATSHGNSNASPISVMHDSSTTLSSHHHSAYMPQRNHSTTPAGLIHNAVQICSFTIGALFFSNWMARLKEEIRDNRRSALMQSLPSNVSSSDSLKAAHLIPPPMPLPPMHDKKGKQKEIDCDCDVCPICHNERHTPTVCLASGYVFCYRCIVVQVREHGKCPVTGAACSESRLIRLKG